jgi:hypothetical protein
VIHAPRFGETRKVFLHIGQKDWNVSIGKSLSKNLQRNSFTRACCARNQTMSVRIFQAEALLYSVFVTAAANR